MPRVGAQGNARHAETAGPLTPEFPCSREEQGAFAGRSAASAALAREEAAACRPPSEIQELGG